MKQHPSNQAQVFPSTLTFLAAVVWELGRCHEYRFLVPDGRAAGILLFACEEEEESCCLLVKMNVPAVEKGGPVPSNVVCLLSCARPCHAQQVENKAESNRHEEQRNTGGENQDKNKHKRRYGGREKLLIVRGLETASVVVGHAFRAQVIFSSSAENEVLYRSKDADDDRESIAGRNKFCFSSRRQPRRTVFLCGALLAVLGWILVFKPTVGGGMYEVRAAWLPHSCGYALPIVPQSNRTARLPHFAA